MVLLHKTQSLLKRESKPSIRLKSSRAADPFCHDLPAVSSSITDSEQLLLVDNNNNFDEDEDEDEDEYAQKEKMRNDDESIDTEMFFTKS